MANERIKEFVASVNELKAVVTKMKTLKERKGSKNALSVWLLKSFLEYNFDSFLEELEKDIRMIERINIKCVFVGRTSSGKSAVLNALLKEEILPSDIDSITSCFISIKGCDEGEGYVRDEKKQEKEIKYIKKFANLEDDAHYDIGTTLEIFYPMNKCELLKNNVELFDTPGLDHEKFSGERIDECCKDSNLLVLVLDCSPGLKETEKNFFTRVQESINSPNIIVLLNKWDLMAKKSTEEIEKKKNIYEKQLTEYFKENFKFGKESIFFVSATRELSDGDDGFSEFRDFILSKLTSNEFRVRMEPLLKRYQETISSWNNLIIRDMTNINVSGIEKIKISTLKEIKKKINARMEDIVKRVVQEVNTALENKIDLDKQLCTETIPDELIAIFTDEIEVMKNKIKKIFEAHCHSRIKADEIPFYSQIMNDLLQFEHEFKYDIKNEGELKYEEIKNYMKEKGWCFRKPIEWILKKTEEKFLSKEITERVEKPWKTFNENLKIHETEFNQHLNEVKGVMKEFELERNNCLDIIKKIEKST